MITISPAISYINTPASFGAEVFEHYEDGSASTYQLANPRGTMCLLFATKGPGGWMPAMTVVNPERFMPEPPETQQDWTKVLEAWIALGREGIKSDG